VSNNDYKICRLLKKGESMSRYRLDTVDEYGHQPTADSNFNESVYLNGWDPQQKMGVWMRLGNRVNEGHAELSVCIYLPDGRVACQFLRPAIDTNERHSAGGLDYEVQEPFKAVSMRYCGEAMMLDDPQVLREPRKMFKTAPRASCEITLSHIGLSPMNGGEPTNHETDTMYGRDFSLGHFNQHSRITGKITLGDESWDLKGFGWRDHSWGPRYWTNINFYRLFVANFGEDRGIMMLKRTDCEMKVHRRGVLMFDGKYEDIIDMDVMTEWDENKDPKAVRLGVRTANRAVELNGKIITMAPLRNHRQIDGQTVESRIAEGFTEWVWDDGRPGIGITEYIERLEDGEPVGFPL
jgi:hypothetical protein